MQETIAADLDAAPAPRHSVRKVLALGAGNTLEWFDWGVYSTMLPFFSGYIFGGDPTAAVLQGLGVFAAGFVARPLGGLVFGVIADRYSRMTSLILTIICVAVGCLGVAFLPSHAAFGILPAVLLLLLRILQGFGQGGELPSLQVYVAENAPRHRVGLWSSMIYVSGNVGVIAGMILGATLTSLMSADDLREWGWRIPFAVGGALGLVAIGIRLSMGRDDDGTSGPRRVDAATLLRTFVADRAALVRITFIVAGSTVAIYAWGNSASTFAISFGHITPKTALWAAVAAYSTSAAFFPIWGWLGDRTDFRKVMIVGAAAVTVGSIPVNMALSGSAVNLYLAMIAMIIPINTIQALEPVFMSLMLSPAARATGVGITYSSVAAVLGGTAPYIRAWTHEHLNDMVFSGYVTVMAAGALVALLLSPSVRATPRRAEVDDSATARVAAG
ncbi:MFS transporter [uncultured Williamsia sp.]|uniref:MFS transporter n=1 Tax=uncultured Williamsia sp. TaxID=259311 RepID=UPI00262D2EE1|nr:MFS transporter [uncultured Williamsia sp.]